MSKKNESSLTVYLEPDEACVVLERKFWDHMVEWYTIMAEAANTRAEKDNWYSIISQVKRWVEATHYDPSTVPELVAEYDYDDNWN